MSLRFDSQFSPRASQLQIIDNQYSIKIVGGRELSRALKKSCFLKAKTKNAYDL